MASDTPEIPPPHVFECGCMISAALKNGNKVIKFSPCKPDCRILALVLEESADQGTPVIYREA